MTKTKIILVSDNHYRADSLQQILNFYKDADYFFHCGDSELPYKSLSGFARVRGNNDYDYDYPESLVLEIGGHRFLLVHGHRQGVNFGVDGLVRLAKINHADIVCFGHTHRFFEGEKDGILLLNPGSLWCNRDGTAPSYMVITLENNDVKIQRKNYILPLQD